MPTWAEVQLLKFSDNEPISLKEVAEPLIKVLTAVPTRDTHYDVGLVLVVDQVKYYVKPSMFMAKNRTDEVCKPVRIPELAYRCEEGQPYVEGCHLLFFNAQGENVGFQTMRIDEKYPHFCNAMPAIGVANKSQNELLVTMQYFIPEAHMGATKSTELGRGWTRMTSLIRLKAINGKIEVVQDDSCLGNPNQIDTIAKARKQLQRCAASKK
jgi:hypothetical protein